MKIKLPYWGIDGCKRGWFCAGLGRNGEYAYFAEPDIESAHRKIKEHGGKIALIDIPIGLPDGTTTRVCDQRARRFIGPRSSSVFPVLCREAITAYRKNGGDVKTAKLRAEKENIARTGKSLPPQGWGIVPKIAEVDAFIQSGNQTILREVHPEVCFRALNGNEYLADHKATSQGTKKRLAICTRYFAGASQLLVNARLCKGAKDDDVLDALAAAITAKLGVTNGYKTLPDNPPEDSTGLPMEMVYAVATPAR